MTNIDLAEHQSIRFNNQNSQQTPDLEYSLKMLGLKLEPIPRVYETNPEKLRASVIANNSPLIFSGLIDQWRSYRNWSPTELTKEHGRKSVKALINLPSKGVFFPKDQKHYEQILTLSEFMDLILSTPADRPCYLAYQRANEIFSSQDYDFDSLLGSLNTSHDTRVWIGSAGTRSMLHSDLKDNLFCQIWGEKKVVLIPWEDSLSAYPCPNNIVNSQLDLANINLKYYPKLKGTTLYTATMGPGDMLFMPRGWWHDIRAQTPSISLNHWFGPSLSFRDYSLLILKLGPRCWRAVAKDFLYSGLLGKTEETNFFFSPPSTGKRLYDLFKWGNFSKENDPTTDEFQNQSEKKENRNAEY